MSFLTIRGGNHHRECHPDNAPLSLHAYFVGLYLAEFSRLLDQMLLHRLPLGAPSAHPPRHSPLVEAKRCHDGLGRTAVCQQSDDQADRLRRGPQAIQGRAFRNAACLVAHGAQEAPLLARVDTDVALAALASGGTRQVRAGGELPIHG